MLMKKHTTLIASLSAAIGFIFSMKFQDMFYWGGKSFTWFYTGAALSYIFSVISIVLVVKSYWSRGVQGADIFFNIISILLVCATLLWTTFIIIAWQSEF